MARGSVFMLGCVWAETKLYYPSIGFATKGKQEAEAAISPEAGETALMERKQSSQANRYSKKTTSMHAARKTGKNLPREGGRSIRPVVHPAS